MHAVAPGLKYWEVLMILRLIARQIAPEEEVGMEGSLLATFELGRPAARAAARHVKCGHSVVRRFEHVMCRAIFIRRTLASACRLR